MRITLLASIVSVLACGADTRVHATVMTAGDVDPDHPGTDPWMIAAELWVGNAGMGELTVSEGGSVSNSFGRIGRQSGATGTATVTGAGSTWNNSQALNVGDAGTGTLLIEAGGNVSSSSGRIGNQSDSDGTVEVTGADSTWTTPGGLAVGFAGNGELAIADGGSVSNLDANIGFDSTAMGTATVSGAGSSWTNNSSLSIGQLGTGTLTIEAGASVENTAATLGFNEGATGTTTVTGTGSTWTNNGELIVGNFGTGELTIDAGGGVENTVGRIGVNAGSTGAVTVTGAGSTWTNNGEFAVGGEGNGTLTIEAGASVMSAQVSNETGTIGDSAGSTGLVTVRGADSEWVISNPFFNIGEFGTGEMTIEAGGRVSSINGTIGRRADSVGTVIVTGADSNWSHGGFLALGSSGTGTLTIENGGSVFSNNTFIGDNVGAIGTATVTGANSSWSNNLLEVADDGVGTFTIAGGGSVFTANGSFIGRKTGSSGTATVAGAGSTWTIDGPLSIAGDISLNLNGGQGTLDVKPGGSVDVTEDIVLFPDGLLRLEGGTLTTTAISFEGGGAFEWTAGTLHVGLFDGDLTNDAGTLAPGESAGQTNVSGDYTQGDAATLQIEIGGPQVVVDHDFVNVIQDVSLAGTLELVLIDSFVPSTTSTFTVLNSNGITGSFDNVASGERLDTIDGRGSFVVNYGEGSASPNQIVLTDFLAADLPGDYNQNGTVDAADYVAWRDGLGSAFDEDAYGVWKNNFGATANGASSASVPEPVSFAMLLSGTVLVFFAIVHLGVRQCKGTKNAVRRSSATGSLR